MRPILFRQTDRVLYEKKKIEVDTYHNYYATAFEKISLFIRNPNNRANWPGDKMKIRNLEAINRHAPNIKLYNVFCTRNISNRKNQTNSPVSPNVFF